MNFFIFILIGAGAGWFAHVLLEKQKKGFLRYLLLGIVGGFLGGAIFRALQIEATGNIGEFVTALVGSILVIWIAGKLKD